MSCPASFTFEVPMRRSILIVFSAFLSTAVGDAIAQRKDPQAAFEPRSATGAGQKYLERMAGDWEVAKAFFPRDGQPVRASGTCRQAMIHDGKFLRSDFVFEQDGRKTTGLGIIGFEPETNRFTSFWIDSRQTRMSPRQSREPFGGDKIVLHSVSLDPSAKEARRSKTVTQLEEGDRRLVHRQYALGSGGEERLMMELVMIRKP